MPEIIQPQIDPIPGEIKEIDGSRMKWTDTGYTVRQYYSHSTPEKGPGPGWDTKFATLEKYGVYEVSELPDEPYCRWEYLDESDEESNIEN